MLSKVSRVRTSIAPLFVTRNITKKVILTNHIKCVTSIQTCSFSNDALKETFRKLKKEREEAEKKVSGEEIKADIGEKEAEGVEGTEETKGTKETDDAKKDNTKAEEDPTSKINFADLRYRAINGIRNFRSVFQENLTAAWGEMTGANKESMLERKFEQSASFRKARKAGEGDEEEAEESAYTGPSVHSSYFYLIIDNRILHY